MLKKKKWDHGIIMESQAHNMCKSGLDPINCKSSNPYVLRDAIASKVHLLSKVASANAQFPSVRLHQVGSNMPSTTSSLHTYHMCMSGPVLKGFSILTRHLCFCPQDAVAI